MILLTVYLRYCKPAGMRRADGIYILIANAKVQRQVDGNKGEDPWESARKEEY